MYCLRTGLYALLRECNLSLNLKSYIINLRKDIQQDFLYFSLEGVVEKMLFDHSFENFVTVLIRTLI